MMDWSKLLEMTTSTEERLYERFKDSEDKLLAYLSHRGLAQERRFIRENSKLYGLIMHAISNKYITHACGKTETLRLTQCCFKFITRHSLMKHHVECEGFTRRRVYVTGVSDKTALKQYYLKYAIGRDFYRLNSMDEWLVPMPLLNTSCRKLQYRGKG